MFANYDISVVIEKNETRSVRANVNVDGRFSVVRFSGSKTHNSMAFGNSFVL